MFFVSLNEISAGLNGAQVVCHGKCFSLEASGENSVLGSGLALLGFVFWEREPAQRRLRGPVRGQLLAVIGGYWRNSRCLSASHLCSYQQLDHVVSAAFHQQYRDTETERERETVRGRRREKKQAKTEWREKRGGGGGGGGGGQKRQWTGLCFLCLLVRGCLNQSLRSRPLETRANDKSAKETAGREREKWGKKGWKTPRAKTKRLPRSFEFLSERERAN